MKNRVIKVDQLARVEGEGGVFIKMTRRQGRRRQVAHLRAAAVLRGVPARAGFQEAPDITARICGICPIAYQMSSVHAMEDALGVKVEGPLRELRRLLYCGEWIESHVLHVYMLHAPDFLGYEDALLLAKDKPELVKKALEMKKIGNDIVALLGGREIHPINVRVGGFYRVPAANELLPLLDRLKWGRDRAMETVKRHLHARVSGAGDGLRVRVAPYAGRVPDQRRPDCRRPAGWTSRSGSMSSISRSATSRTRTRCIPWRRGAGRTRSARWRAST